MTRQRLKVWLSVAGLVLTAVALKLGDRRLNWVAIVVLAVAVVVRFTGPRSAGASGSAPSSGDQ